MNSYGTESDKNNCSFYYKIGACRHGDRCARKHTRPNFSPTVVLYNIYANPKNDQFKLNEDQLQQHFDMFYTDMFIELSNYGYIDELIVTDNICDHLVGDVFCKYRFDEDAKKAQLDINNRFYAARPIFAELSPVVSFRDALCKQHDDNACARGKMCNFMHLKRPSLNLLRDLKEAQVLMYREKGKNLDIRGRDINEMNFGNSGGRPQNRDDRGRNDRGGYQDRRNSDRPQHRDRNHRENMSRPESDRDYGRNYRGSIDRPERMDRGEGRNYNSGYRDSRNDRDTRHPRSVGYERREGNNGGYQDRRSFDDDRRRGNSERDHYKRPRY
eukprot:NODE_153_length_15389_cov_1.201439.p4 type:complete len:328 gc:universal NODE_153_length_15389_cov_1.201439:1450-467(-)